MITVLDAVMGSGKTTHMIQYMNSHPEKKYIYITPSLAECHRIAGTKPIPKKDDAPPMRDKHGEIIYDTPSDFNCSTLKFKHPESHSKSKLKDLEALVDSYENIVTTHNLLKHFTKETLEKVYMNNYVLILDEAIDPVEEFRLSTTMKNDLFRLNLVKVADDGYTLEWNYDVQPDKRRPNEPYYQVQKLCDQGNLIRSKRGEKVFIWEITEGFLSSFAEVFVLTYQFQGSVLRSYLDIKKIGYTLDTTTLDRGLKYGHLIDIVDDPKLNQYGGYDWKLSQSKSKLLTTDQKKQLSNNMKNYTQNLYKAKSGDILWTTFKDYQEELSGYGFSKSFLEQTCKSTNIYKDRWCLMYLVDRYMKVTVKAYLEDIGGKVDEDTWALNELLQWMFRSRIREGKPIKIYLPSRRMREMLRAWCLNH